MAEYHFVSIWQIQAPIERVWEEIYHTERWPSWWKYVVGVDELEPGAADGVGKHLRLLFRTRLPYTLGFDVRVTRVRPPSELVAEATGELNGTGRWTLTSADGGTLVRYNWDIRTTRRWMNLLSPVARPVFSWNHDELMREGGQSLARRLGVDLAVPDTPPQNYRPARAAHRVVLGAVLAAVAVLGWRRRTSPRGTWMLRPASVPRRRVSGRLSRGRPGFSRRSAASRARACWPRPAPRRRGQNPR